MACSRFTEETGLALERRFEIPPLLMPIGSVHALFFVIRVRTKLGFLSHLRRFYIGVPVFENFLHMLRCFLRYLGGVHDCIQDRLALSLPTVIGLVVGQQPVFPSFRLIRGAHIVLLERALDEICNLADVVTRSLPSAIRTLLNSAAFFYFLTQICL